MYGFGRAATLGRSAPPPPSLTPVQGFPLLRIPRIDGSAVEVVRGLLARAASEGAAKLMVDLRGIAGGEPEAAYALAGLLVKGELGTLREKDAVGKTYSGSGEPGYSGELVLLVDGYSAGAAEILAAVLQQKAGAKLVGIPTFGWAGERSRIVWLEHDPLPEGGVPLVASRAAPPDHGPPRASLPLTIARHGRALHA